MSELKINYQQTLNLPKTEFSMRAGLAEKEPKYLAKWEDARLYEQIKEKSEGKPTFILHDGPPYANGNIHIGHALNKILKDFILKFKTMSGYKSTYVPGWDCHGLPIEHQLLKEMKKRKSDVDCVEFRKSAHDYAMKYVGIQREQFERLGIFGEWDDPYLTLSHDYEYWILKSLGELTRKKYVYRGLKPVNWCYQCETALAEAEVEYEDHTSTSVYVKFEVTNPKDILPEIGDKKLHLLIWTTTPWTLISNVAVAVHENFDYCLLEVGNDLIIVERTLAEAVAAKAGVEAKFHDKTFKGSDLTKLKYEHPFGVQTNCVVVTADYVTREDGTGLVHTAPGHGQDDFQTGKKYNLDVLVPVNDSGVYTKDALEFEGQHVAKVAPAIIEALESKNTLLAKHNLQHSYPHCWRCKKPIIFRATQQWFLSIDHEGLRGRLKDTVNNDVKWIPQSGHERILGMVTGRPDWCLSRQRYWGVPIPALKSKKTGEHFLYPEVIDHFAKIAKEEGTDAWFSKDVSELIPQGFKDPDTGETEFEKTFDILDVWFDSGVSHQAVVKGKMGLDLPVDLYLEGSDQHRGWFQSSLIPAIAMEGKAPYKAVLTHGFVVDAQGRKMSKSLGNVVSPHDVIKNSGADILRLWVSASSYNEDIRVSKEILDRLVDAYRKIRNTFRYILGNISDFDPDTECVTYDELHDLDKWALYKLSQVTDKVRDAFDAYEFAKAYKTIYTFCNEDMSNFYLDILKDRLYISATKSTDRKAAQTALYYIIDALVRMVAPITCFTAEEIFEMMPKSKELSKQTSIHLLDWPVVDSTWRNAKMDERFELLLALRPHVMKALEDKRRTKEIGSSLEAKVIFETASQRDLEYLQSFKESLPDMFVVSQAEVKKVDELKQGIDQQFSQTLITITKADGQKCSRSWKYSTDVGADPDHPSLSLKSAIIVKEMGYARQEDLTEVK